MSADDEMKRFRRKTNASRREIGKAVDRAANTDLRHGHYVAARRIVMEIRDIADDAAKTFERRQGQ